MIIVGAGLAGMTAAHHLRDRDIVVLEVEDRVGGRTLSGAHDRYWFNSGAQFVWDQRTLAMCQQLGLDVISATSARSGIYVRGRLAVASSPYSLLLKMPLSVRERIDFGRTIVRLRRMAARMNSADRSDLDTRSLEDLMGTVMPIIRDIIDSVCENGTGVGISEVSGWIGLAYSIHLFGGDVNDTLKAVRGGTQAISKAIQSELDPERIVLQARVQDVHADDGSVAVSYTGSSGDEVLRARHCIVAIPAPAVLELLSDLPQQKRSALERMGQYTDGLSVAWLTDESEPMPWDHLLAVPVIGASFELLSNNAFFARSGLARREPGGTLVTLSISRGAEELSRFSDEEIAARQAADLKRMFPSAASVIDRADTRVKRWRALPPFRKGWLRDQAALRAPAGNIHFAGDYTAQPGTPGAVGSGYHAAMAVRDALGDQVGGKR